MYEMFKYSTCYFAISAKLQCHCLIYILGVNLVMKYKKYCAIFANLFQILFDP